MDEADFEDLMRIQRMALRSIANESQTEDKIKLMNIINELVTVKNKTIHKESIIIEASQQGMNESDVERNLEILKKDNLIREPQRGFIKKI